jgi:Zn ribbon nucleic-acid-binding protein
MSLQMCRVQKLPKFEKICMGGRKCPYCKDGYLYWWKEDKYGAQYYKCGKCENVVKI